MNTHILTTEISKAAIAGCGWIGFPLALRLKAEKMEVTGSVTSSEKLTMLSAAGIKGMLYKAGKDLLPVEFKTSDVLILAFPPRTKSTDGKWYVEAFSRISDEIRNSDIKKVIMLSSTSVYPEGDGLVSEEFPITEETSGNSPIFRAERTLSGLDIPVYILRLGGLAGSDRLLARHFTGKKGLSGGGAFVNLLHFEDAVRITELFVRLSPPAGIYNACSPLHPLKSILYSSDCARFKMAAPDFIPEVPHGKIISVEKLQSVLKYCFIYPDPANFDYNIKNSYPFN